jgi:hypothetical protein
VPWSEAEKAANPLGRGFLRATANRHTPEHADGTLFFALGDTWWPLSTNRFRWYEDDRERPIGAFVESKLSWKCASGETPERLGEPGPEKAEFE